MNRNIPYLSSMALCKKGIQEIGYAEHFIIVKRGFKAVSDNRLYSPDEIKVLATLRFEGNDHQKDFAELCLLETRDGIKGVFEKVDELK